MNILFSNTARKLMSFRSVKVQFGISLLWKNRDQLLNKFSFITVRIWQRFSCNLAYPGWHLILKNDSSDVELRIAMAEMWTWLGAVCTEEGGWSTFHAFVTSSVILCSWSPESQSSCSELWLIIFFLSLISENRSSSTSLKPFFLRCGWLAFCLGKYLSVVSFLSLLS